ncbi:hypothetical protein [Lactiplantibacillus plantarum]
MKIINVALHVKPELKKNMKISFMNLLLIQHKKLVMNSMDISKS